MKNLSGASNADKYIEEELFLAEIPAIRGQKTNNEVPYTLIGQIGDWKFERNLNYWKAYTEEGKGFPLAIAIGLRYKKYPIIGENQPKMYGEVIRINGNCDCPDPQDWEKVLQDMLQGHNQKLRELKEIKPEQWELKFDLYHLDNQIALNQFSKTANEFYLPKVYKL